MSLLPLVLVPLLAQVGPFVTPGQRSPSALPPELQDRAVTRQSAPTVQTPAPLAQPVSARLADCLAAVNEDPSEAAAAAETWFDEAVGDEKADAGQCLGLAYARLDRWDAAHTAFLLAHDVAAPSQHARRARLGSMAGNAALAKGDEQAALTALDSAHKDAAAAGDAALAGDIAIDRSRALVALDRPEEAQAALAEARAALPGNAEAWLLSATLARRMGNLAEAQQQIERAAELLPVEPQIGLEAGRIAILAGRDEAARKSWQSVVDAAPKSEAAQVALGYLDQLGPAAGR